MLSELVRHSVVSRGRRRTRCPDRLCLYRMMFIPELAISGHAECVAVHLLERIAAQLLYRCEKAPPGSNADRNSGRISVVTNRAIVARATATVMGARCQLVINPL